MTAIILAVLGTIGKVLLTILVILLILIALILFVPVTYQADIKKQDPELSVRIRICWLFRFVHARISLEKQEKGMRSETDIRAAGIRITELLKKRKKKSGKNGNKASSAKPKRAVRKEAPKKPTVKPGSRAGTQENRAPLHIEVTSARHPGPFIRFSARVSALIGKIRSAFRKIAAGTGVLRDWLEYMGTASFEKAKTVLLHEGKALIQHILPRRIAGEIRFGTEDPAKTGMILGLIAILYPVIPEKLQIEPEFTEAVLETDITCRGHLMLIVLFVRVIRILLCKDVRRLIGRIRKELKSGTKKKVSETDHKGRGKPWRKTKKTLHFRTT